MLVALTQILGFIKSFLSLEKKWHTPVILILVLGGGYYLYNKPSQVDQQIIDNSKQTVESVKEIQSNLYEFKRETSDKFYMMNRNLVSVEESIQVTNDNMEKGINKLNYKIDYSVRHRDDSRDELLKELKKIDDLILYQKIAPKRFDDNFMMSDSLMLEHSISSVAKR